VYRIDLERDKNWNALNSRPDRKVSGEGAGWTLLLRIGGEDDTG
jgi:hypothetical protein